MGLETSTIEGLIKQSLDECRESFKLALESGLSPTTGAVKLKSGPGKVQLTSSQGFRTRIWSELERCFSDDIYAMCKQVKFLQTALNELHLQNVNKNLASSFWTQLGELIQEETKRASPAVVQTLEEDYPKLLKNYYEMVKKLNCDQFKFELVFLAVLLLVCYSC